MSIFQTTKRFTGDAMSGLRDKYDTVRDEAQRRALVTKQHIRRHPFQAVGYAILAGLVAGVVMGYLYRGRGREA